MQHLLSRRSFLGGLRTLSCAASLSPLSSPAASHAGLDFPLVDFHVHLDNSKIEKALELSSERGIKFGIVEHAGTRENEYPVVLSNDDELAEYVKKLEGRPVFKGVQAEWRVITRLTGHRNA